MATIQPLEDILLRPLHWTPALPAELRQVGVSDLLISLGLDFESYGTARMMARDSCAARRIVGKVDPPVGSTGGLVLLENLPSRAVAELDSSGVSMRTVDESTVRADLNILSQAWHLTHACWPELSSSVEQLVRCVHVIKAPSNEVDCSFSKPDLPFTVFLSIPGEGSHARVERVAEALVHETMHLQLSLLERRIQLVESDRPDAVAFSPWRESERNVQGVLHALYVFVVVQRLWQFAADRPPQGLDRKFAEARVSTVRQEVERAQQLVVAPGLTREGRQLVRQLLTLGHSALCNA